MTSFKTQRLPQNEKLTVERNVTEERINKVKREMSDLRVRERMSQVRCLDRKVKCGVILKPSDYVCRENWKKRIWY